MLYGLDWIATVPPTLRLSNEAFGDRSGPLVFGWIVAGHQVGAAAAAFFGGAMRELQGDYELAFMIAGMTGIMAAAISLLIDPTRPQIAAGQRPSRPDRSARPFAADGLAESDRQRRIGIDGPRIAPHSAVFRSGTFAPPEFR